MSTLQHKSQKQHLKILGAGGPRADIWGRGLRAEKNKYAIIHVNYVKSYCLYKSLSKQILKQ